MKLSQETISILQNFSSINNGLVVEVGNTIKTISPQKTIFAEAQVPEHFEQKFCIYDLAQFLGTLSLFNDPELEFKEQTVAIASGKGMAVKYVYADENTIVSASNRTLECNPSLTFKLTADDLQRLFKGASILTLPNLVVNKTDSGISVVVCDVKNSSSNEIAIDIESADCDVYPDEDFKIVFKLENLKLRTASDLDYVVSVEKAKLAKFETKNVEYFVPVEAAESRFN